ncbi:MAG: acylphosphatase [Vicinamibacterales bacterium]
MLVARRFVVEGRVQGVGFRLFVLEAARREGVGGWVANRPDGRVEVRAQGDRDAVTRLESHVRRGPAGARVANVQVIEDAPEPRTGEFEIRRSVGATIL